MKTYDFTPKTNPLEEIFKMLNNAPKIIIIILLFFTVISSCYTVEPEEQAVITRFGKYHTTGEPGFHLKLPFSIDRVQKLKTSVILRESFGFYSESGSQAGAGRERVQRSTNLKEESHMLTGDLNVADVRWVVQYKILKPEDFLFNIRDPRKNVRDVSEAVMRRVVGDRVVNDVLTTGKAEINASAKEIMQNIVNKYGMGISIERVELQDVDPPELVMPAFNDVNIAKQEKEEAQNKAEAYRNRIIPEARGKAQQTIANAEGYAIGKINRAKGDADKFTAVLSEYDKAPKVTQTRLYLELLEKIFNDSDSLTIVDPDIKGVLPIYPGPNLNQQAK